MANVSWCVEQNILYICFENYSNVEVSSSCRILILVSWTLFAKPGTDYCPPSYDIIFI